MIGRKLRSLHYDVSSKVEVGPFAQIVDSEAANDKNDLIVLIRRMTLRGHMEKEREDSAMAVLSKYPGKAMIVRRRE